MLRRWLDSLVNRAVLLVVGAILLTALAVSLSNSLASRQELQAQAEARVAIMAGLMATELDQKLSVRLEAISDVASHLAMDRVVFENRAQLLVDRQVALRHLFDGIYLFDAKGTLIGAYPEGREHLGTDIRDRPYFRQTLGQLTPVISEPYRAYGTDLPEIMVAAPVFDHQRQLVGVLGGAIHLDGENFMADIASVHIGRTGYVGIGTQSGITLAHGDDTSQVMQPIPASNAPVTAALQGFEGTQISPNKDGQRSLVSIRQLNQAPWFVGVIWPLQEAFAPASRLTDMLAWVLLAVMLVLVPIALWGFRLLLAPLTDLSQQITDRHLGLRSRRVSVGGGREIRQVADTFNTVMDERTEVVNSLADREAFFRSLSQRSPIGILQADVLGRVEFVNPACEDIVGVPAEQIRHLPLTALIHSSDRHTVAADWRRIRQQGGVYRGRFRVEHQQGQGTRWVDVMTTVIDAPGKTLGTLTVIRDITHELAVEAELQAEQKRAESILSVLREGVLLTDPQGAVRYANQGACEYMGSPVVCEGSNFFDRVIIEADGVRWRRERFLAQSELPALDAVLRNAQGQKFDVELTMLRLSPGGDNERLVFVLRDDSERRQQERQLSWEASHDALTGVMNRRGFSSTLIKWLERAEELTTPSVLMLIDLDYFKPVNDHGGHLLGDELLRRLAEVFSQAVRQSDCVARIGGDEFGVILPGCGLERAELLAEEIRAKVEALTIEHEGQSFGVTASIGLTVLSQDDSGPRETIARADEGCYAAKAQGRNQVVSVPLPPEYEEVTEPGG